MCRHFGPPNKGVVIGTLWGLGSSSGNYQPIATLNEPPRRLARHGLGHGWCHDHSSLEQSVPPALAAGLLYRQHSQPA